MNRKRNYCVALMTALAMNPVWAADDEFQRFVDASNQGAAAINQQFEQYKQQLEEDFSLYKAAYQKAFEQHKKQISQIWGDYRPGDKTHWVQYGEDDSRTSVNFRSGEIDVEILVDQSVSMEQVRDRLNQQLAQLIETSEAQAFNADVVAQRVEQQLKQSGKMVTTGEPRDKKMIEILMPEFAGKSPAHVSRLRQTLIREAKVEEQDAKVKDKKIIRLRTQAPVDMPERAKRFQHTVLKVADKEQVPVALVFAVIESESAFNPMAKSHIPAYGLMQIVPRSAGKDATAYLYGKPSVLSPSYLYNADNNILIGAAYLHILFHQYLNGIENPVSRLYCTIAAYNTGAGNVAKAFVGTTNIKKAAKVINTMTPVQVYNKLRSNLPYDETRQYMKKVATRLAKYQG